MTSFPRSSVRRIIAATDGSPNGDYSAHVAREIAAAADAELVVLAVTWPGQPPPSIMMELPCAGGRPPAPSALAERVRCEVLVGYPSIEIVRTAEQLDASLLVIGRRPLVDVGDAMLGPTADQIVRRSSVPCLVIPTGTWHQAPRILAAVDGTDRGAVVLAGAARVAELCRGSTRAVTVFPNPPMGGVETMTDPMVGERVRRIAELRKDRGRRSVDAAPGPPVLVRHGDPVDEVLAEAGDGVDVVAVGMHRLGQPDSYLERGTARRILRRSTGAVLTVPL